MSKREELVNNKMIDSLPSLSNDELKEWYIGSETSLSFGRSSREDMRLNREIEGELNKRGLEHMRDY